LSQIGELRTLYIGKFSAIKGSGAIQNYTFLRDPNNGDYSFDVENGDVFLLGNPDAFIAYNSVTNAFIDGSIYFSGHSGEVSTTGDEGHYKSNSQRVKQIPYSHYWCMSIMTNNCLSVQIINQKFKKLQLVYEAIDATQDGYVLDIVDLIPCFYIVRIETD
jgi:hypothetical protein